MRELKAGDFTGIYTKEDNKPLFYTGIFDRMKDADGRPCVFLATDPENKNTFHRWTQSDLLKRGYYITKNGKNTIPRDAARLHIIFTHSGALDGVRATVERDMFGEWIITTETGEKYAGIVGQLRNAAFCVILKTETAEEIATRPQEGPTAPETETCGETTTSSEKAPQEAKPTFYKYGMRLRGYSIGAQPAGAVAREDDHTGQFYDIISYNAPLSPEDIKHYSLTPLEAPTTAATTPDGETPTDTKKTPENATSEATTAETATEGPETSTATQDTTGSDTRPPRAQEANQEPGHAAGDHTGPAADHITGPGTAAGDYTGPTTGNTSGAAAEAITGRTTTTPQNPGNACENATGRTERTTAEQVHTPHAKQPPRPHSSPPPTAGPGATPKNREFWPILPFTGLSQNDFRKFSWGTHFGMYFRAGF